MVCRMTKQNDSNVVPVEEFWQRKVNKLHVLYDYNDDRDWETVLNVL